MSSILDRIKERQQVSTESITIDQYLDLCKTDVKAYASPHQRLLEAIGEPTIIDTSKDPKLARIFQNKIIKTYESFSGFYGMENTIEQIVNYLKAASQGLEERNQILYLLGPVGGGKSSLAERVKLLMEKNSFYAIKDCPVNCSPLNLFDPDLDGDLLEKEYDISRRNLKFPLCPSCLKKMEESEKGASVFEVIKIKPNRLTQTAIAKTEPADESTQDISTLVGKVDVRKLAKYPQSDPRSYDFCGGLNKANRGCLDFVEMFKAPIKTLNPLLTATQEGNYMSTEGFSAIPWDGIIVAHSNESEWDTFRNDKKNEAFLDRVCLVRVPYSLVKSDVVKILEKLIRGSDLEDKPCAPHTIDMLADFIVLTCMEEPENSDSYTKLKVYNGETLKDTDPNAKSISEYREDAGIDEGMTGMSTRFAFKVLSATYNMDDEEVSANPVYLMQCLLTAIVKEKFSEEKEGKYINYIREYLQSQYVKYLKKELQTAYLESYSDYGQNLFDRYFVYADNWTRDEDFRDPETGIRFDREALNKELEKIEKTAEIVNPKDFRNETVNYINRYRANHEGEFPKWNSYEKMKEVIEARMFSKTEELLPIISFGTKKSKDEEKKHQDFVERMLARGYTLKTTKILVKHYHQVAKSS
jgi:serine protein kinase